MSLHIVWAWNNLIYRKQPEKSYHVIFTIYYMENRNHFLFSQRISSIFFSTHFFNKAKKISLIVGLFEYLSHCFVLVFVYIRIYIVFHTSQSSFFDLSSCLWLALVIHQLSTPLTYQHELIVFYSHSRIQNFKFTSYEFQNMITY